MPLCSLLEYKKTLKQFKKLPFIHTCTCMYIEVYQTSNLKKYFNRKAEPVCMYKYSIEVSSYTYMPFATWDELLGRAMLE